MMRKSLPLCCGRLPLEGFRILDMTRILAGPFCTMVLGDMGADILKVEHTKVGDDTRTWGPPFSEMGKESAYFLGVNRNKRSVSVNLKTPEGKCLIRELALKSDVVLENFVPGKAAELGVDYETLSKDNEQLVYGSLSGFGSSGPKAQQPAYDVMISGLGGLMGITGTPDGEVCKVGVAITDVCAGLVLHGAVLAALLSRTKTNRGQKLETSLLNTQVASLANIASSYLVSGQISGPQGTSHTSIVPYQSFVCRDGKRIIVGALNDSQFQKLCRCLERDELSATGSGFETNSLRVKHRDDLVPLLNDYFRNRNSADWILQLEKAQVPCAPINDIKEVFENEQVVHNERVIEVEHPTVGLLKMVAPAATFHGTPLTRFLPPPLHGQHTDEVLKSVLGLSAKEIESLSKSGAIYCCPTTTK